MEFSSVSGAFFLLSFFPPPEKIFSLFSSLSLFTEKASEEKEKGTLKITTTDVNDDDAKFSSHSLESFYLLARILSSSLRCCVGFFCRRVLISVAFSRATHHWKKDFCERKKGACDFFY